MKCDSAAHPVTPEISMWAPAAIGERDVSVMNSRFPAVRGPVSYLSNPLPCLRQQAVELLP